MKRSTVELLRCPGCRGALSLGDPLGEDDVDDEGLLCPSCERNFPIRDGVAHFISPEGLEGLNRRFVRFYRRYSRFETLFSKLSFLLMGMERKARMEVLSRLELGGGRLLEVSIGSGGNLPFLYEFPDIGEVYGLDISPEQIDNCRRLVDSKGWPVELFLGMAEALPFKDESFDAILHLGGINFFSDKKRAIEEMIRVARPGCKIIISDESEKAARTIAVLFRLSRFNQGRKVDTSVPVHLIPDTMQEIREEGIWKRHGHYHGYVIEFRKPLI